MKTQIRRHTWAISASLTLVFSGVPVPNAFAVVDDAHSFAMEAANEDVEDGFAVRDEFWSGILKSGSRELIRHQLFKGNEYAFWLGVDSEEDCELEIKIYDIQGKRIPVDSTGDGLHAKIHLSPTKTGSYFIVISAKSPRGEPIPWALAYGFR